MDATTLLELIALGAIWGASFMFSRIAVPVFGPFALVAVRVVVAAMVLHAARRQWKVAWPARELLGRVVVIGLLNTALPFTLFAYATLTLTAGYAAVLNATVPLFGVLVALVSTRDFPSLRQLAGLLLGLLGVLVLVHGDLTSGADLRAIGAGLAASLSYAIAAFYSRKQLAAVPPLAIAAGSQAAAAVVMLPLALASHPAEWPGAGSWGAALMLGVVCTGLAYALFFRLLARVGPARTVLVTYLIPVFGMLWGALFLGEPVTVTGGFACLVIMLAVAAATRTTSPSTGGAVPRAVR